MFNAMMNWNCLYGACMNNLYLFSEGKVNAFQKIIRKLQCFVTIATFISDHNEVLNAKYIYRINKMYCKSYSNFNIFINHRCIISNITLEW